MTDLAGPWTELRNEEDWEYECRIASKGGPLVLLRCIRVGYTGELLVSLSTGGSSDPDKLRDRATAHKLILEHALAARNLSRDFRDAALCSRTIPTSASVWCGRACQEARTLFELARQASGTERSGGFDFLLYEAGARLVGWRAMGRLACRLDRFRA